MSLLRSLHTDIDARVAATRTAYSGWLCRRGCEGCCHRLADIPKISRAEWELLAEGLALLPPDVMRTVGQEIVDLAKQVNRPLVCPLLDRSTGSCRVYLQRPVACRTYGYYVQRDKGLYCNDIQAQADSGVLNDVVWGNHDAIDRRLDAMGAAKALTEWFQESLLAENSG
ncbi:YkgJ family cysteine cluster protein [Methylomonas sp. UP202]|uniref:YkgJ family cysteine cluster protein n=1 Tax=Methylomonas sp. UP202 TaxID=3040943 RepID=UPI00143B8D9B|nr:YkgJ family cysteine cluster protein [Methylomonas sp. UP202]NJA08267.1 YkgJ family cysteine cluster protein [Methylococcaceae bacterium WWC4]WGS86484.1 YkgJ family cysteine cluster protein [Methylomonas sp. UP202]